MNNADIPAYPITRDNYKVNGLTKREKYCLENKVPGTGDPELDDIIRQSLKQDAAMAALESGLMPYNSYEFQENAHWCKCQADALLSELEET